MSLVIPQRLLTRGGTAANLAAVNEVLLARERCFEIDTGRAKDGDGVTPWNSLPYTNDNIYNFAGVANGVQISSSAGVVTDLRFQSGLVDRWIARKNGDAETGANAGSKFEFHARADDGSLIGIVYDIDRATRVMDFKVSPTVPDEAYDSTSWNGNNSVPTKNAIRDKFESLGGSSTYDPRNSWLFG